MFNLAEISINYTPQFKLSNLPLIGSSSDAEVIFRQGWSNSICYKEEFVIMLLNRANRVLGLSKISTGGLAGTIADPKVIFQTALKANASAIILCHNHPSGNLNPSKADLCLTEKLKNAGKFLDIQIYDHIILTSESYYSFADEGLL